MTDSFEGIFGGTEPSGETSAAFDLSGLTVREAMLALQMAMAREASRSQIIRDVPIGPDLYPLRFCVGEAEFIQERHDMGPQYALDLIGAGRWSVRLLTDVVFTALVGGGAWEKENAGATSMTPEKARRIVDRWVAKRPWAESAPLAQLILQAGVVGIPDEPPGKDEGAAAMTDPPTSPAENSGSPPSTDTPLSSD